MKIGTFCVLCYSSLEPTYYFYTGNKTIRYCKDRKILSIYDFISFSRFDIQIHDGEVTGDKMCIRKVFGTTKPK